MKLRAEEYQHTFAPEDPETFATILEELGPMFPEVSFERQLNDYFQVVASSRELFEVFDRMIDKELAKRRKQLEEPVDSSQEIDLATFNRSMGDSTDMLLIRALFWADWSTDYETKASKGKNPILWKNLEKKVEFDAWTEEDRRRLIKEHLSDELSSTIPRELYQTFSEAVAEEKAPIIEQEELLNDTLKILWRTVEAQKRYRSWLKKQLGQPKFSHVVFWRVREELEPFKGRYLEESAGRGYGERILLWYSEEDWQAFETSVKERTHPHLDVSKEELACLRKHQAEALGACEIIEKGKGQWRILHSSKKNIATLENWLLPSRRWDPTHLEQLPSEFFKTEELEELDKIPIPLDLFEKHFTDEGPKALDKALKLIQKIQKQQTITVEECESLERLVDLNIWDLSYALEKEQKRRQVDEESGQELREGICQDCLQRKLLALGETFCDSCKDKEELKDA